jgi:hypothetical protein
MHRREGAIRLLGSLCYWCYGAFERYGAARVMDFADVTPETIAEAIAEEIGRRSITRPLARGGVARAAALIAELL